MIFNKHQNKNKFAKRGLYFVSKGQHKGCFLLYIDETSSSTHKTLAQYPEGTKVEMTNDQVKSSFENSYFEFVKIIPKRVYAVCLAQHMGASQ